jgi:hypothetical protein
MAAKIALLAYRPVIGVAGDAHQATHGLHHQVVTSAFSVGPILAKTGDGAIDQPRVDGFETVVVQPILLEAADLEVLHHHIGLCSHFAQQGLPFWVRHVDGDAALIAVASGEVAGLTRVVAHVIFQKWRAPVAGVVTGHWALDLDHISAQVGQHLRGPRACQHTR